MASLGMNGPYKYSQKVIDEVIPDGVIGNYALGSINPTNNVFVVRYVGRSDKDLKGRIGHSLGKYTHFKFSIAKSPSEAYYKECRNWHDFGEDKLLDNDIHPDKPDGIKFIFCPVCSQRIFDNLNLKK